MGLLHRGDVVDGRYSVLRKLGEGQFAEVWEVKLCDGESAALDLRYALKLEKSKDRHLLRQEHKVLKRLSGLCSQVIAVEGTGVHNDRFFMIMQLMGETLFDARRAAGGCLDLPSVKAVGLSTLDAIAQLHGQGFIHRDIKPANLVVHPPNASAAKGTWALIDFGLARRYLDEAGGHLPARGDASFRGSTTYASVHAHRCEDLSRRDDLWSWFYLLVECVDGCLPWRPERDGSEQHVPADKAWVLQLKEACMTQPQSLTRNVALPEPLAAINTCLMQLGFADEPDYDHLRGCLHQLPDAPPVQLTGLSVAAAAAAMHQHQQQRHGGANGVVQQGRGSLGGGDDVQQPDGTPLLTPGSPLEQDISPCDTGGGAAAGSKRTLGSGSTELDQMAAKRARGDGGSLGQPQQQRQARQASSSSLALPSPADTEDGRADSRQGGRAPSQQQQQQRSRLQDSTAAGGAAAGGDQQRGSNAERSSQRSSKQQQQQGLPARPRPAGDQQQQQQQQQPARRGSAGTAPPAAAATTTPATASGGSAGGGRRAPSGTGRAGAAAAGPPSGSGRAAEITDLLAAFNRDAAAPARAATQQVVEDLCALAPLEAVCAIGLTLDALVHQSAPACLLAVAQLLSDLAAFTASGAAAARKAAQPQQQPQQQQPQQQPQQQQPLQQQQQQQQQQSRRPPSASAAAGQAGS